MGLFKKFRGRYLDIYLTSSRGSIGRSIKISFIQIILISLFFSGLFIYLFIHFIFLNNNLSTRDIESYIRNKRLLSADSLEINLINPIDSSEQYFISKTINKDHNGVDISVQLRAKIFSPAEALVLHIGDDNIYGNNIILSHKNNFYTFYGHLDTIFIKSHQFIKTGELIGLVGETGNVSGPHLHFEIWDELGIIDPRNIITEFKERDATQ